MENIKSRVILTDEEVRLLISSLSKRISRLQKTIPNLVDEARLDAEKTLIRCSELLYKIRIMRKTVES